MHRKKPSRRPSSLAALATIVLLGACGSDAPPPDGGGDPGVVARAGDHTLTPEELVAVFGPGSDAPAAPGNVMELADLWIDYTLLASAVARDSTLFQMDLSSLVDERADQEAVARFRQEVQLDTALAEPELRERYAAEAADAQVRARHLLVSWPRPGGPEAADSVRAQVRELRQRVASGAADFASVAREYSDDTRYGPQGGDMGWIFPGEVIEPVEEVAFSLDAGELSEPFESNLGVHLVEVEGRRTPPMAEYRRWLQERRVNEAAGGVVRDLVAAAEAERQDGALEQVRRLALFPRRALPDVDGDQALLTWEEGAVTVDEVRRFMLSRPVPFRLTAAQASYEELDRLILGTLLQGEVLVAAARERGLEVSEERRAEIRSDLRDALRSLARRAGVARAGQDGVEEVVDAALGRIVRGEQAVVPLGGFSWALAAGTETGLVEAGMDAAVQQLQGARGEA
jgi:hypothetical protein